jgi:hypothetical protein
MAELDTARKSLGGAERPQLSLPPPSNSARLPGVRLAATAVPKRKNVPRLGDLVESERGARSAAAQKERPSGESRRCSGSICRR